MSKLKLADVLADPEIQRHAERILALQKTEGLQVIMKKQVPAFKNEDEERTFWATHDSTEFVEWSKAKRVVFPNLKPSTIPISLRLPESIIAALKLLANKRDVPYQSLLKLSEP